MTQWKHPIVFTPAYRLVSDLQWAEAKGTEGEKVVQ